MACVDLEALGKWSRPERLIFRTIWISPFMNQVIIEGQLRWKASLTLMSMVLGFFYSQ